MPVLSGVLFVDRPGQRSDDFRFDYFAEAQVGAEIVSLLEAF